MTSRLVMGVAVKILLISTLSFCVEAQLSGVLLVDVEAKDDVQVFWSIFDPMNVGVNLAYTVHYAINSANPSNFTFNSSEAESINAGDSTSITLPAIPAGSDVTVVVVANSSTGVLVSSPPVTRQTFGSGAITAPVVLLLERFDNDTTIQVTWLAINSAQILSYDIQYRIYLPRISSDLQSTTKTTINSPGPSNLALNITGVDGDTNYEVRVRGVVETDADNDKLINTDNGDWSDWIVSQVKIPQGETRSGTTSVYAACNGIIFSTFLLAITVFF